MLLSPFLQKPSVIFGLLVKAVILGRSAYTPTTQKSFGTPLIGTISFPAINHLKNKRFVIEVFKCMNSTASMVLKDHFKRLVHK